MPTCCCISDEPIEDTRGRIRSFPMEDGRTKFQTSMLDAPCASCSSYCWFQSQYFLPCCAQYYLRKKVLGGNMQGKYQCFQGYFNICCVRAGSCREDECPDFCAFLEGLFCNCVAVSASRMYVMEKYNLASDPCDYRLIRINNCIQLLACVCDIAAMFDRNLRRMAHMVDCCADISYHAMSGCMTAQVAYEMDYQNQHFPNTSNEFSASLSHQQQYKHVEAGAPYSPPYQSYNQGHVAAEVAVAAVAVPISEQEGSQHLLSKSDMS